MTLEEKQNVMESAQGAAKAADGRSEWLLRARNELRADAMITNVATVS